MPVFQYERSLDTRVCFLSFSLDWIQSLTQNQWLLITKSNIKEAVLFKLTVILTFYTLVHYKKTYYLSKLFNIAIYRLHNTSTALSFSAIQKLYA